MARKAYAKVTLTDLRAQIRRLYPRESFPGGRLVASLSKEEILAHLASIEVEPNARGNAPASPENRDGDGERNPSPAPAKREKTCNACGQTGLHWQKDGNGRFMLHDANNVLHTCIRDAREGKTPDFDTKVYACRNCGHDVQKLGGVILNADNGELHSCHDFKAPVPVPPVEVPSPAPPVPSKPVDAPSGTPAELMARAVEMLLASGKTPLDEERVRAICAEYVSASPNVRVQVNELPEVEMGRQHTLFAYLLACCTARVPVMLVGPAGGGKTFAAEAVAEALELPFYCMVFGPQSSKTDILGFVSPTTKEYHSTALREAFENGGVVLLDELDAANPQVLTAINAILANNRAGFPDRPGGVERHEDFVIIAGANTFGNGADAQYVGRFQLDAATLDRFFNLTWNYDAELEKHMVGLPSNYKPAKCVKSGHTVQTWYDLTTGTRRVIEKAGIRHIVSPRATMYGARLLDVLPKDVLEQGLLWKGIPKAARAQVEAGLVN